MTKFILETEYLYNGQNNHDKVYNVAIRSTDNDYLEVIVEWGARTSVLQQMVKYKGFSKTNAYALYDHLIKEKLKKGYSKVKSDRSGRSNLGVVPVSGQNKSKATLEKEAKKKDNEETIKKLDAKYNPTAIPERRLDFDL